MSRLTRAETQERNRARVLAAARAEFTEHGFRDAKIDVIAERAELTRGAVYSNFPGKRALYLAVLADDAERAAPAPDPRPGHTATTALGAFARAWVTRLDGDQRLGADLLPEIVADERVRRPHTQLVELAALLLALALEQLSPPAVEPGAPPARLVRLARTALTQLHGARQLSAAAPGFVEPFDVISACEQLAGLTLNDYWAPPPASPPAHPADDPWTPPPATDLVRGEPAALDRDGVVAVLGLHRLSAVEEAVRAGARSPGPDTTLVLVTGDAPELAPLARLVLAEVCGCLRQAVPRAAWPRLAVVCDETGAVAAAAGLPAVSDGTEAAVRIRAGRITARADGRAALHAIATNPTAHRATATRARSTR
jgi:AcrR family transcriptional regulator